MEESSTPYYLNFYPKKELERKFIKKEEVKLTLLEQQKEYLMNTYATLPIEISHGEGSYLYDINDKNI